MIIFTALNGKKAALVLGAVGFFLLALITVFLGMQPVDKQANDQRVVTIPAGASTAEIADLLDREQVIRNPLLFRIITKIEHMDGELRAGEYEFSTGMSTMQVLHKIAQGEGVSYSITIPEGFTVEQIAALLAEKKLADREQFLRLARKGISSFPFLRNSPDAKYAVEGFLFPDTYRIPKGMKEEDILAMMLKKFENTITEEMQAKAAVQGMDMYQMITLASLVEREAKAENERPIIAEVFLHRLQIDMPIQSCATIQYILGTPKPELTIQDTQRASPYNTYLHPGLPPGPIANPGLASIQAVLNPAKTDVLYFVAKPDGTHIFSRTYGEHLQAIERADKMTENKI